MMIKLIKFFILLSLFGLISIYIYYNDVKNTTLIEDKVISVQAWDNLPLFLNRELWYNEFFLKLYLNLNKDKKINVQAGDYRFLKWENIDKIIEVISYGAMSIDEKITILEWWNIYDIDELLSNKWIIKTWEFIAESKNIDNYKTDFPFLQWFLTLEWFLYPDTYFLNINNFDQKSFIIIMLNNFKSKVYVPLLTTLNQKDLNEVMILSSIVEKEERNLNEKSTVAWILKKRLENNWMIGADITACYAFELTSENCRLNLSKYIYEKNAYNTRTMTWLPKTPINNPNIESIKAVLNSKNTNFWYYLHDKDWFIHYGKTNQEHIENKNKYLK